MLWARPTSKHAKGHAARSSRLFWLHAIAWLAVCGFGFSGVVEAQAISRYTRTTGNINYVVTGGSLRAADNNVNPCSLNTSNTQSLSGIPAGSTIRAAYLYWGGSGSTADNSVSLNSNTVNASRTFSVVDNVTGLNWRFFGGFAVVTNLVSGNGSFTFSGLTVTNTGSYCGGATASGVVAGWSLIVVYENASEPLRAINIFDGLDYFYGSSITRIADGFRIPVGSVDGKMSVVTWEGDTTNSGAQNGFSETLQLNGNSLGALSYDSSSRFTPAGPAVTTYGVDIDTYDISPYLAPGQTSASAVYSSGQDFVLLTAKVVSATSEPVVDLQLSKTHSGNFTVGANNSYSLVVSSITGSQPTDFPITITDTLPAGLSFVSASGTGWSCGATGQVVTCTNNNTLLGGSSLPPVTLTVAVANAAYPSVTNTASVSTASYDPDTTNNSASDITTVVGPNLTTSTKTVQDLNGGDANPGDTLRYTITLIESAGVAATGVSVTDDVPGNVSNFSVVAIPAGATNASTGTGTGANGTGYLNITNVAVPANGSVVITFNVLVANGTSPGATINNTATIVNPAGANATPSAPTVIVSQSQIPGSGTKQLYLQNNVSVTRGLSRSRPTGVHNAVAVASQGGTTTWTMSPTLQKALTLNGGSFPIVLLLSTSNNNGSRTVGVTLSSGATTLATTTQTVTLNGTVTAFTFNPTLTGVTLPIGSTITLTVTNSTGNSNRPITITPYVAGTYSRIELNSATVINVDSVATYSAAYPSVSASSSFLRGTSTAYIRAVVSDPFGSFDITAASITLLDASNNTVVNAVAMTQVADSGAATKTYEYAYAIPSNAVAGAWTARITANEGVEGVTDLGVGTFTVTVPMPTLLVTKVSEVLQDPINGASNPKRIPDSLIRYTITVTNTGVGTVDGNSLVIADIIPAGTSMYVDSSGGDPVEFIQGATPSGLSFNYLSNVSYSTAVGGGVPFGYSPSPNANGVDPAVTGIRIAPAGVMSAAAGGNQPSFTIRFRVRVK